MKTLDPDLHEIFIIRGRITKKKSKRLGEISRGDGLKNNEEILRLQFRNFDF